MSGSEASKLVVVEKLTRLYGSLRAVNHVSFDLAKGEVLGFLGPNGAGKSTTMQMLCGALAPSQGSIEINGINLLDEPIAAKQQIGFLPEQPPLFQDLLVDEYLKYCAKLRRITKHKVNAAVDLAKQRCGLTDVGGRLIVNLSKGFQQRVAIAQAIIHSPAVIVLDEPTVGLDPIQIQEIRRLIKMLGKEHGVILSTHILPEVQMTCDRVQIIRQGELVFSESIQELDQRMQVSSAVVGFKNAPTVSDLEAIVGVTAAEKISNQQYRVRFEPTQSPIEDIVKSSVESDWGLIELTPDSRSLEMVFMELTSADTMAIQEYVA